MIFIIFTFPILNVFGDPAILNSQRNDKVKINDKNDIVIRAALDIGSGATKLKVAEVNLKTKKIVTVLVNESFPVQYQEAIERSPNASFNEEVMRIGIDAINKSKEIALKHGAEKVVAIATASFRRASNSKEFIKRIFDETGVEVIVIDQKLEGILAFEATAAQVPINPKRLVVWDIGGGSFQFAALDSHDKITVYRGVDASIPFKNYIIKEIKRESIERLNTPNPLSYSEMIESLNYSKKVAKKVDGFFRNKLHHPETEVIGIGNIFAYGIYPLMGKKVLFTPQQLFQKVKQLADKTDTDLGGGDYANVEVTNPILVLGFMQALGIRQIRIMDINNADGALLYSDFWKPDKSL